MPEHIKLEPVGGCLFSNWSDWKYKEQIQLRYRLIRECVGTLYPDILADEIYKLRMIGMRLFGGWHW